MLGGLTAADAPPPTRRRQGRGAGVPSGALRCLIVTSRVDVGGLAEVAALLARKLPDHGMRTAVLDISPAPSATGRPSGRIGRALEASGAEIVEADRPRALAWMREWAPDVVSAHGALPAWALPALCQSGVPCVETLHGMHDMFGANWAAEASRAAGLQAIVAVSELVRQQYLAGNPGFPADRVVTIPNGVDERWRAGADRDAARASLGLGAEFLIVSLARHCLQKNTYALVGAFGEVARWRSEAHLVVSGELEHARYYRRVRRRRESLPCRDRIHLRANAPAPAALLAAADAFALDSFFEGWPLAPMEALCAGVPVVLSDVGGAREQIGGERSRGFLVGNPLGDPLAVDWESAAAARFRPQPNREQLTEAMERVIADRRTYARDRSDLARESAERFSPERCVRRHAEVLRAAAAGAPPAGRER